MSEEPILNEHIARAVARSLLNIVGFDFDTRYKHTYCNQFMFENDAVTLTRMRTQSYNGMQGHLVFRNTPGRVGVRLHNGSLISVRLECVLSSDDRTQQLSYELDLPTKNASTMNDALKQWASFELFDGDNCYHHDRFGAIKAYRRSVLDKLPDTLLINLNRTDYDFEQQQFVPTTNPVNVPLVLNCAELTEVTKELSEVVYNLVAFMVGRLRRHTPDDHYVFWYAYIRVPGGDQWHQIMQNPISESMQYTAQTSLPTAVILDLLSGNSVGGEFCMKAWYQRSDAPVLESVPSVAAWEASWREDLEHSVAMQNGCSKYSDVAVGVPVANVME